MASADFKKHQYEFTAHIRDPEKNPKPEGIEDRRMAIYRELLFNNIEGFIASGFPVIRKIYSDENWHKMIRDFFSRHKSHSPYFLEISQEFIDYLQNERIPQSEDPAGLIELAHYEWVELALSHDESEIEDTDVDPDGDLMKRIPVLSPLAWPLSYQYPVHRIRVDYQPRSTPATPTHLLVWRQRDFSINFMQLNEISLLLLQKMKEEPARTGLELLTEIAGDINHPKPAVVLDGGKVLLDELRKKQVILGTRP